MSGQPKWTRDQQRALDARGHTVLVSAAAGSGKTAVLTERAVRRMLDPADPISADRLLVVTFTRDAAREMKQLPTPPIRRPGASGSFSTGR